MIEEGIEVSWRVDVASLSHARLAIQKQRRGRGRKKRARKLSWAAHAFEIGGGLVRG